MLDDKMIGRRCPKEWPERIPVNDAVPGRPPAALLIKCSRPRRVLELDGDDPRREFLELRDRVGPATRHPSEIDLEADGVARRLEHVVDRTAAIGEQPILEFVIVPSDT